MVPSRVRSRRTWARTSSASVSGARPKWWCWGLAEPGEQLGGAAATAVGVSAAEGREAGFAEPGGGLWGEAAEALRSLATLHMRFGFQESDFVEPLLRARTVAREGEAGYLPRRYDPKAAALEAWHKNNMPSAHQDLSRFLWEARLCGHLTAEVYASELLGDLYVATATPDTFVAQIGAAVGHFINAGVAKKAKEQAAEAAELGEAFDVTEGLASPVPWERARWPWSPPRPTSCRTSCSSRRSRRWWLPRPGCRKAGWVRRSTARRSAPSPP